MQILAFVHVFFILYKMASLNLSMCLLIMFYFILVFDRRLMQILAYLIVLGRLSYMVLSV